MLKVDRPTGLRKVLVEELRRAIRLGDDALAEQSLRLWDYLTGDRKTTPTQDTPPGDI